MDAKPIIIIVTAVSAAVLISWFAIALPRIKKKCHRAGFEAGVRFAENLEEKTKQVKQADGLSAMEKTAVLTHFRKVLIDFEKEFKEMMAKKQQILGDESLSLDEKMRRILGLDKELENWVEAKGMA